MSAYITEEEQIERIRKFWKEWGNTISTVLLAAVLIVVGWQWWERHQLQQHLQASDAYEQLVNSVLANNSTDVKARANVLLDSYQQTPYAALAALILANRAIDAKDFATAQTQLQWVIDHSNFASGRQIARIRLARFLLSQKKLDEALQVLVKEEDPGFKPMIAQVRGDIYLAQNKNEEARMNYTLAMKTLPAQSTAGNLLKMKLIELANPENHVADRNLGASA